MKLDFQQVLLLFIFFEWVLRVVAVYFVPKNRKPSSAMAWLFYIMILPTIGFLSYWLIGSPKLSKSRRSKQHTMDKIIKKAVDEASTDPVLRKFVHFEVTSRINHLIKLATNLSGLPAFSSNKIELLPEYDDNFVRLAEDIAKAKKFVHIEFFIIVLDDSTQPLFDAMAEAVKRGVKVRVLFDYFGTKKLHGYRNVTKLLTEIGVEWYSMLPLQFPGKNFNRPDLRNHRKIVVIDGVIGYTGSQNLIRRNYHRRDGLYYDELMVRVTGPVVTQLHAAFITDWYSESDELLIREEDSDFEFTIELTGTTLAQVVPSGPGYDNDNNLKLFTSLIHTADKRVVIVNPYFVPDDSLMIALTSAAQRGVEVVMINSEIMDQRMVGHAQRSYYEELLKAGVQIYLYNRPILLHSKYITIDDDIATIGSSNLDMRSFQLDLEVTLLIYDKVVITDLNKMTTKYLAKSKSLSLSSWQARPKRTKLLDNLARLTASLQ